MQPATTNKCFNFETVNSPTCQFEYYLGYYDIMKCGPNVSSSKLKETQTQSLSIILYVW